MAKRNSRTVVQQGTPLDARLRDYGAITRISAAASTLYRRTGNWPIYAAATGSALAMATGASASIITSGILSGIYPSPVSVNPGGPNQLGLIPGLSVKIHAVSNPGPIIALQLQASHENIFFSLFPDSAKNFAFEAPIALGLLSSSGIGHSENVQAYQGYAFGNFAAGKPGFVGLSFSTALGNTDYGWIELEFNNNKAGLPYYLEALAFGIDTNPGQTPGTLLAGEINGGFIPEPSTLSLSILAAGAAGVMALRRRRKQAASADPVL